MPSLNHIKHYTPIQPTVKGKDASVDYNELFPDAKLQDFIYCYWQLKTTQKLTQAYNYNVVADGCIDVFFELNNPQNSFVMGFCKTNTEFPLEGFLNYIGIRFLPTAFTRLFKIKALEISNRFEALDDVVPSLAKFITHSINDKHNVKQVKSMLDGFFLNHLTHLTADIDMRFARAYSLILQSKGFINIETDLDAGISPRQLHRMFEFYTGTNAKTFSKVVRFQNLLGLSRYQDIKKDKLYYDAGYYDQAHFIKEFKMLYGTTPGRALDK